MPATLRRSNSPSIIADLRSGLNLPYSLASVEAFSQILTDYCFQGFVGVAGVYRFALRETVTRFQRLLKIETDENVRRTQPLARHIEEPDFLARDLLNTSME